MQDATLDIANQKQRNVTNALIRNDRMRSMGKFRFALNAFADHMFAVGFVVSDVDAVLCDATQQSQQKKLWKMEVTINDGPIDNGTSNSGD